MAEYFSVDRTESDVVVLIGENGQRIEVPFSEFDIIPYEGMVFRLETTYIYVMRRESKYEENVFLICRNSFSKNKIIL